MFDNQDSQMIKLSHQQNGPQMLFLDKAVEVYSPILLCTNTIFRFAQHELG